MKYVYIILIPGEGSFYTTFMGIRGIHLTRRNFTNKQTAEPINELVCQSLAFSELFRFRLKFLQTK